MSSKFTIVIEKDVDGYYSFCPELKGCQSQGDTFEEALSNIKEAIDLYLEVLSTEELNAIKSKEVITTTYEAVIA